MSRVPLNSVRVRLTLWNGIILALVLAFSGVTLCFHVQDSLSASVDRELEAVATRIAEEWGRGGRGPGPRHRGRRGFGPGRHHRHPGFGRPEPPPFSFGGPGPPPPGFGRSEPLSTSLFGATALRSSSIGRARIFAKDGMPLSSMSEDRPWDRRSFALSAAGQPRFSTIQVEGETIRVFSTPIVRGGVVEGVIQLAYPLGEQLRLTDGLIRTLLTLIPVALVVAGLAGIFLTGRTLRPVRELTHAAAQIGEKDLSRRLVVTGQDEFAELATTFNGMIARLEQGFQRLGTAYEQQRRFTADASHELRTPLTRIKASASLALSEERPAGDYRRALQVVDQAADAMNRLIQDLLLLARADAEQLRLQMGPVEVATLFRRAIESVPQKPSVPIRVELPKGQLAVRGNLDMLVRLLVNLLENSLRHTPAGGQIILRGREQESTVTLEISDTGEGIPREHLPHVLDRFYRVDHARTRFQGGTGLGLAICQSIVRAHGGELTIDSDVGRGTTVSVTLPRAGAAAPETTAAGTSA
jgi:heavy metal sensor kinase